MSVHIVLTTAHYWLTAGPGPLIPNPDPSAPPGELTAATNTLLAWMKWGGLVGAVAMLIAIGIMMTIGRRNRNNLAIEGAVGIPWVVGGLAMVLGSASIVGFFLQ